MSRQNSGIDSGLKDLVRLKLAEVQRFISDTDNKMINTDENGWSKIPESGYLIQFGKEKRSINQDGAKSTRLTVFAIEEGKSDPSDIKSLVVNRNLTPIDNSSELMQEFLRIAQSILNAKTAQTPPAPPPRRSMTTGQDYEQPVSNTDTYAVFRSTPEVEAFAKRSWSAVQDTMGDSEYAQPADAMTAAKVTTQGTGGWRAIGLTPEESREAWEQRGGEDDFVTVHHRRDLPVSSKVTGPAANIGVGGSQSGGSVSIPDSGVYGNPQNATDGGVPAIGAGMGAAREAKPEARPPAPLPRRAASLPSGSPSASPQPTSATMGSSRAPVPRPRPEGLGVGRAPVPKPRASAVEGVLEARATAANSQGNEGRS